MFHRLQNLRTDIFRSNLHDEEKSDLESVLKDMEKEIILSKNTGKVVSLKS